MVSDNFAWVLAAILQLYLLLFFHLLSMREKKRQPSSQTADAKCFP